MHNELFYRHMISKRAAVKALVEINKALHGNHVSFWGYERANEGEYDRSVYAMADDIKRLVREVEEYRELKKALTKILK